MWAFVLGLQNQEKGHMVQCYLLFRATAGWGGPDQNLVFSSWLQKGWVKVLRVK